MSPKAERLVFRNVRALDPSSGLDANVDVVIEDGVVRRLGAHSAEGLAGDERTRLVPAEGCWLLPGLIDLHAHFREPGQTHKEDIASGLRAAAAGGFTRSCVMPNTLPVNDHRAVTELMILRARHVSRVHLHPIGAITLGQKGEKITDFGDLRDAGVVALSDDGRCVTNSAVMRRALEYARCFDLVVIQHAEDHALTEGAQMHEGSVSAKLGLRGWPRVAEDVIVARDLLLTQATGSRYHLAHASTAGSVAMMREAKARGLRVTAEVTPHHLLLTDAAVLGYQTACKVNPPLREPGDVEALWEALRDGTLDAIATDHAPHSKADKDCAFDEAAPGMIGLELCLPLLMRKAKEGAIPLLRLIEALTDSPARTVDLPRPSLREGNVADLCVYDPSYRWTAHPSELSSRSANTPFLGTKLEGRVVLTLVGGEIVYELQRNENGNERINVAS